MKKVVLKNLDQSIMEDYFYSNIDPVKRAAIRDSAKTPIANAPANMFREPVIREFKPGFQVEKLED